MSKAKPMPGWAFIELDPIFNEMEGGIIISDGRFNTKAMRTMSDIGKVVDATLYPEGRVSKVAVKVKGMERLVYREAYKWNIMYKDIIGKRVCLENGVVHEFKHGDDIHMRVRLEHIEAILPDNAEIKVSSDDIPRCPRCRSNGVGNMIMTKRKGQMVCPKCGCTAAGDHVDDLELGSSAALDDLQCPERRVRSSKVFSYKGQGSRS